MDIQHLSLQLRLVRIAVGRPADHGFDNAKIFLVAVESATRGSTSQQMSAALGGIFMRYILLIYLDEAKFAAMDQKERDGFGNGMLDYDEELRQSGHYLSSEPLKAPSEAITVRSWGGTLSSTDGPFMETKEHLSGFCMVSARDLNEAVQLAARMPLAAVGSIEVRPLDVLERVGL